MGLLNTLPALFLPNLFSAMETFLMCQFFLSLPTELEDAAYIDGYNKGQYVTDFPGVMAGAILSVLPIIILFAIFQKQFIEGVAHTEIKG